MSRLRSPTLRSRRLPVLSSLLVCGFVACGPSRLVREPDTWPPPVPAPVEQEVLLESLASFAATASSFTASSRLAFRGRDGKLKSLSIRLALTRPDRLYIKGYRPLLPTFFTLVGNATGMWLDVPSRHKIYHADKGVRPGAAEGSEALLRLTPEELVLALAPAGPVPGEAYHLTTSPRAHELLAVDGSTGRPTRRLVFDTSTHRLTGVSLYDDQGLETTRTFYDGYREENGLVFPYTITIERPRDGAAFEFAFDKVNPRRVPEQLFTFEPSAGRELIELVEDEPAVPSLDWSGDEVPKEIQ